VEHVVHYVHWLHELGGKWALGGLAVGAIVGLLVVGWFPEQPVVAPVLDPNRSPFDQPPTWSQLIWDWCEHMVPYVIGGGVIGTVIGFGLYSAGLAEDPREHP
jgi:hypothetical protein